MPFTICNDTGEFMKQLKPQDISWALTFVVHETLRYLVRLEKTANEAALFNHTIAPSIAGDHCQKVADEWLKIVEAVYKLNKEAGLILLAEKALYFYWLASSCYYKEITDKQSKDFDIHEKCLSLKITACAHYYRTGNGQMIEQAMWGIGAVEKILKINFGSNRAGLLLLKLAKLPASLMFPATLTQLLYGLASKNLERGFYDGSRPDINIVQSYQEALNGEWGCVTILREAPNKGPGDLDYCLGLEKSVGDEIERMSKRLLQLNSLGYYFPNIAYAGSQTAKVNPSPTLRRRRGPH